MAMSWVSSYESGRPGRRKVRLWRCRDDGAAGVNPAAAVRLSRPLKGRGQRQRACDTLVLCNGEITTVVESVTRALGGSSLIDTWRSRGGTRLCRKGTSGISGFVTALSSLRRLSRLEILFYSILLPLFFLALYPCRMHV